MKAAGPMQSLIVQEVRKVLYGVSLGASYSDAICTSLVEECRQAPRLNVRSVERNVADGAQGMINLLIGPVYAYSLICLSLNSSERQGHRYGGDPSVHRRQSSIIQASLMMTERHRPLLTPPSGHPTALRDCSAR